MEVWKTIENYERYKISSNSKIIDTKKNKILVPYDNKRYKRVPLTDCLGKQKHFYVHRLIALSFIPNIKNKPFINHIDGNPSNNSIENLEWCTHKENMRHAYVNGLSRYEKGEKSRNAKLTNEIVKNIVFDNEKISKKEIKLKYNISKSTLYDILSGRNWSEVTGIERRRLNPNKKSRWDKK